MSKRYGWPELCALLLAAIPATGDRCAAEILPANRRMAWVPGKTVGVPGGIPERRNVFVNVRTTDKAEYRCAGNNTTDDSPPLQAAMKACPADQVVYVPAGTYRLDNRVLVQLNRNYTLRGEGQGRTIFRCTGGRGGFAFGTHQCPTGSGRESNQLYLTTFSSMATGPRSRGGSCSER
jgi:hypothetical protein